MVTNVIKKRKSFNTTLGLHALASVTHENYVQELLPCEAEGGDLLSVSI